MTQEIWLQQAGRHGAQTDKEYRLSGVPREWTVEEHFVVFGRPAAHSDHTLSRVQTGEQIVDFSGRKLPCMGW